METSPASFVLVMAAAVGAPLCAEALRRYRIPAVLFELLLGMLIGPQLLGWAEVTPFVGGLSQVGLAFLFLLAGYEIDFARIRGEPLNNAVTGWLVSFALGLAVAGVLVITGFAISDLLIGLALTTTAIGTLLPMLKDRGVSETQFGAFLLAAGGVGEFGPILAITLLLSGDSPAKEAALLLMFAAVAIAVMVVATRAQPPAVVTLMRRHLHTSSQLTVRVTLLLLGVMVLLAYELGLDFLLGAFTAGVIFRLATNSEQAEEMEPRLNAIGFGFLIPIFFVVSGMNFDLEALFGSASVMLRVPLFLALFLVVRGAPALVLYRRTLRAAERRALALLQATALPLVVAITEIGLETERMKPENATALVGAAMLSVLVFPLVGFRVLERSGGRTAGGQAPGAEPREHGATQDELERDDP